MKKGICLLLSICCLMTMTGCSQETQDDDQEVPTLSPAEVPYHIPDGDEVIGSAEYRVLYTPDVNLLHMTPRMARTEPGELDEIIESLAQRQLETENQRARENGEEDRELSLYGDRPVEVSGGICTVNLGTSALRMPSGDFYKFCIALATTLCDLNEISFVNVLVAEQSVGMDITGSLAMGSLTGHPNENLPVLWEQMEAKRTPLGQELAKTPLNTMGTLYYPLPEGRGISCEARLLTFEGQTPQQLCVGLLEEMDQVLSEKSIPAVQPLLIHDPVISELDDGGRLVTLSFYEDLEDQLKGIGLDAVCLVAAITYTFTTFIPGVAAVCIRLGEQPVTTLSGTRFGPLTILGGLVRRELFRDFLMDKALVYLKRDGKLTPCEHTLFWRNSDRAREQLLALMEGPTEEERRQEIEPSLPEGLRDDDILGVASEGDTLLVNLSGEFRKAMESLTPEEEMLACYSMVNTLCELTGLRRVCFFFEGEQTETVAGALYWAGTFFYNPSLKEETDG